MSSAARQSRLRALLVALAVMLVTGDLRADGAPISLQVQLVARLAAFDRNFAARAGKTANILVVRKASDAGSVAETAKSSRPSATSPAVSERPFPLAGVRVTMVWTSMQVGKDVGFKRTAQMREASTDSSGAFVICGVSPEIRGTIQAERGDQKTAEVEVEFLPEELLAFQDLDLIDVPLSDSAPTTGEAIVSGRVVNKDGAPIGDARVTVSGTNVSTMTAANGTFRMANLPSGTRALVVRRVGFNPRQIAVNLTAATPVELTVTMKDAPPMLDAVEVEGKFEAALKKNGFTERKRMGMGKYFGPKELERRQLQNFSSLFHTVPGFTVQQGFGGSSIRSTRGSNGCVTVWIDGIQYREGQSGELDSQLLPEQLLAVETYSPVAAPSEFKSAGQTDCSVVVVWTNRTLPRGNTK